MLKGGATEASIQAMMDGNARLEQGIEELRQKYAAKAEADARAAEVAAQEKRTADALACVACAEKERLDPTVSMVMDDPDAEALRQSRMAALKARATAAKKHLEDGGGELREIVEEDFLKEVTSQTHVVVHFFHDEFMTCKVMDKHLRLLAPRALGARFLRLDARKAPFFVGKLKVRVLPTLVFFKDGVATGRQTGFEGLVSAAGDQDFPTARLLRALMVGGVLGEAARKDAAEGGDDEEDEEEGFGGGGGSQFEAKLARARAAMAAGLAGGGGGDDD